MNKKSLFPILLLMLALILSSCTQPSAAETPTPVPTEAPVLDAKAAIEQIMADRLEALQNGDYEQYMAAIGQNNQFFYNEQERWFMNMIDPIITEISFEIVDTEQVDDTHFVATIHQKHRQNRVLFDFEYPLLFILEDGQWMDYGYHFNIMETDRFLVKYMDGETRVDEFAQMLDDAFDHLDAIYDLKPLDDYEMKLFSDQEMLRQRCIPANLWTFTGWSEPDESLKMYTGHPAEYQGYAGVVQHELVHHISIRICNNNFPIWILEGIAMYDGSAYYGFDKSRMLETITKDNVSLSIDHLEENDLTTDLETDEIYNFYRTSYMYVRYIVDTYGHDKLMEMFYEAGKKPFHDSTLNATFEVKNQQTMTEVLRTVLGLSKTQLTEDYMAWLDTLDIDKLGDLHG